MNYNFPNIINLDQVREIIRDKPEFIIVEKEGYTVVNYVVMSDDTFPDVSDENSAILRECRGLIFDNVFGDVLARRYHKFFNVNERNETNFENIDLSQPHIILEKLDGSMVSPIFAGGYVRWTTKMGITDTAMEAEYFIATNRQHEYEPFAQACMELNMTPIFEWCSRKNRIVIDFPEDQLILTGIRDNWNGQYMPYEALQSYGRLYNFPVVKAYPYDSKDILNIVRSMEDSEGVVIRFDNGHMIKIKSDWYVRLHKIKELITEERDVVKVILMNQIDDLIPLLNAEDKTRTENFRHTLINNLKIMANDIMEIFNNSYGHMNRKTFAIDYSIKYNKFYRSILFKMWDIGDTANVAQVYEMIVELIIKSCGKNLSYDLIKKELFPNINY